MKTLFDKSKVTHIEIYDVVNTHAVWQDEKVNKFLWTKDIEREGYYRRGYLCWSEEEIENSEGLFDNDCVVYQTPYIRIFINETCVGLKYFKTVELAGKYCKKEFPEVNSYLK